MLSEGDTIIPSSVGPRNTTYCGDVLSLRAWTCLLGLDFDVYFGYEVAKHIQIFLLVANFI